MGCDYDLYFQVKYSGVWVTIFTLCTKTSCGGYPLSYCTRELYRKHGIQGDYCADDEVVIQENKLSKGLMFGFKNCEEIEKILKSRYELRKIEIKYFILEARKALREEKAKKKAKAKLDLEEDKDKDEDEDEEVVDEEIEKQIEAFNNYYEVCFRNENISDAVKIENAPNLSDKIIYIDLDSEYYGMENERFKEEYEGYCDYVGESCQKK